MLLVLKGINFYSLIYTTLFTLCSGFVLISSAAGSSSNLNLFSPGEKVVYKWRTSVLVKEMEEKSKEVGFFLDGKVMVSCVWGSEDQRLLKLELDSVRLQAKSGKGQQVAYQNRPFLVILNKGKIDKLFAPKDEAVFFKNIKKGVASLFQLQASDEEKDTSGRCNASISYSSTSNIRKIKRNCTSDDLDNFRHVDQILGINIESIRITDYNRDDSSNLLRSIKSVDSHKVFLHAKQELGSTINSEQSLDYLESLNCNTKEANSIEQAIIELSSDEKMGLEEESLLSEVENMHKGIPKKLFSKEVGLLRGTLKTEILGSMKSAKALLQLLEVAKVSSSDDISKALAWKKNELILQQLYDVLGYTQTQNSHKAVMKHLHLDREEDTEFIERYLWALSFSTHPNVDILTDLLNKYRKYTNIPDHIRDTLILSLASMARTLSRSQKLDYDALKILRTIEETIINGYDYAKDQGRYIFINALKNLQSASTIPKLIEIIRNGILNEEALAWRAVKYFGKSFWTKDILKQAEKTLFQLDKKHDTSSRAMAVDLLLEAGVTDIVLSDLLHFVASNETNYEVKQYVFQNIKMLSDKCGEFYSRVNDIIKNSKKLNNYSALSPRGLSVALSRNIFRGSSVNGSLVSVQEIKGGIVKRGVVDVILDKVDVSKDLFTLGIFAGGLSSFVSSNSDDGGEEDETSTAGMELTVMGTQIRPFVFFEGQGELMGHVWSGTASDMTPAFQALILVQDHTENLRLGNGFIVQINMKGAVSFDLSGKIEISIWNRNAQSLIEKSVGYVLNGLVKVDSSLAMCQVEFEGSIEPKLSLEIDADFANKAKMCMRLSQPDSTYRQKVIKIEAIPEKSYEEKVASNRKREIPGTTYALNRKNNEMCSEIFN